MGRASTRPAQIAQRLFVSGRPISSGIAGVLAGASVASATEVSLWRIVARTAMSFSLITMAGFVFNDVYDRDKDRLKKVRRPISLGLISSRSALVYAVTLVLVAATISPTGFRTRIVLLATIFALWGYSVFSHRFATLKGLYTAGLCCMPLIYGVSVTGAHLRVLTLALLAAFILGRETYLDVLDLEADQAFGLRTIPVAIGSEKAKLLGTVLMLLSSIFSTLIVKNPIGVVSVCLSVSTLMMILLSPGIDLHSRISWTRLPMLLGALALASTIGP